MDKLRYEGVFEVEESGLEVTHDCSKPKADPTNPPMEFPDGDEWQLGNRGDRETAALNTEDRQRLREARERNRRGGGHNVA